ncbi:hypothetical protein CEP54_000303 [Fusarium duplospermum]|uniref:Uncharacterized protein n=1 Tax=Fusarium duplospermum TaxID=1325734 RepID=A0A428R6R9_9HYPO|nr:hypothetical protein CEP54_000303 [Fusarium duplospermum]
MKSPWILIEYEGMNPLLTEDNVRFIGEENHFSRLLAWVGNNTTITDYQPTDFERSFSHDMIAYDGSQESASTHTNSEFWAENHGQPGNFTIFGPPSEDGYSADDECSLEDYHNHMNGGFFCMPRDPDSTSERSGDVDWEENFYDVVEAIGWTLIWE